MVGGVAWWGQEAPHQYEIFARQYIDIISRYTFQLLDTSDKTFWCWPDLLLYTGIGIPSQPFPL